MKLHPGLSIAIELPSISWLGLMESQEPFKADLSLAAAETEVGNSCHSWLGREIAMCQENRGLRFNIHKELYFANLSNNTGSRFFSGVSR